MYAVLRVDLEALVTVVLGHDLIDASRAVTLGRFVIEGQVGVDRNVGILQRQVDRLIFLMVGVGQKHRGQLVEADHAIRLGIGDLWRFRGLFHAGIIRRGVTQGHRDLAAEQVLVNKVEGATEQRAELVNGRTKVARAEQLVIQPAGLEAINVTGQLIAAFTTRLDRFNHRIGGQHAGLHGRVAALDLGEVQGAQIATNQCATREDHLR